MRVRSRRRRAVAAISAVAACVLALSGCSLDGRVDVPTPPQAEGPLPEATVQQLQDAVTHAMGVSGSSGAIVGVWAPWTGSWVTALGTQRPDGGGEVDVDMQFRAGKVTRAMTCDILYRVVAEGTVRLDDVVSTYVAGVPNLDVTLGQLCDGTSGIGSYSAQLYSTWLGNPERQWDPRYLASFGLGQPRTSDPGAAYRDSDAGYVLLGLALERATGRSAAQLIRSHVAGPLGLSSTSLGAFGPEEAVLQGGQSLPGEGGALDCANPLDLTASSPTIGFTDSGAVTDIHDLGRYVQALATGALAQDEDRFANPLPVGSDGPSWFTADGGAIQAGPMVGQFGRVPGYVTAAFSDTRSGLTVAVVLNNSAVDVGANLAWELAAIASKAPGPDGQIAAEAGLPWTPEQQHQTIAGAAVCAPPAAG